MNAYDNSLRHQMDAMLALPGRTADARVEDICSAIHALHRWDPTAINVEVLRINLMKLKITDWAERGGSTPVDRLGWSKVFTFVENLGKTDSGADRDWSTGAIELQHSAAVPIRYDYVEGAKRISSMLGDFQIDALELLSRILNLFNAFIEDFGRRNNHVLEIITGDMTAAITERPQWEPEWAFVWPTYHGAVGVYAYNDWVAQSRQLEWTLVKTLLENQ